MKENMFFFRKHTPSSTFHLGYVCVCVLEKETHVRSSTTERHLKFKMAACGKRISTALSSLTPLRATLHSTHFYSSMLTFVV